MVESEPAVYDAHTLQLDSKRREAVFWFLRFSESRWSPVPAEAGEEMRVCEELTVQPGTCPRGHTRHRGANAPVSLLQTEKSVIYSIPRLADLLSSRHLNPLCLLTSDGESNLLHHSMQS